MYVTSGPVAAPLQQGGPVLHVRVGLHVDQTTLPGRKQVINHDLYPPAEPETEMEYSAIIFVFCESLVWRDDMVEQGGAVCNGTERRHKPGIKALEIEISQFPHTQHLSRDVCFTCFMSNPSFLLDTRIGSSGREMS